MAHFLAPMLARDAAHERFALRVRGTTRLIARDLHRAFESRARRRGLLGREGLADGEGLVIAPCTSVHTAFMRFAIDVVFVARDGRVLKVAGAVRPWRIAAAWGAFAVVELAAGSVAPCGLRRGMELEVLPARAAETDADALP